MYRYFVETLVRGVSWLYTFDADDVNHAIEQCMNAWPDEEIIMVKKSAGC